MESVPGASCSTNCSKLDGTFRIFNLLLLKNIKKNERKRGAKKEDEEIIKGRVFFGKESLDSTKHTVYDLKANGPC